jgi:phosphate transport system protein
MSAGGGPDDAVVQEPEEHEDLRTAFHHALDEIRETTAKLAAGVTENIPRATEILLRQDLEGAEYLIMADDQVDKRVIELEDRCYEVLALQAPVAGDLRRLMAALRIIAEIERSNDLAVNICKAARRIYGHPLDPRLRGIIQRMGDQAHHLFREATESYMTSDATRAAALADMDSYLDDLQRQFIHAIFESHAAENIDLQVAVQLAVVARFYERIGDHAVNIGERVRFLVEGWLGDNDVRRVTRAAASDLD